MLYTKKFVFTVSLCAMLAVNPVLAVTNPVEAKAGAFSGEVGKAGTVYSDWAGRAESGIAGVAYVNGAVDAAGNAAQWAENHAAAAAQSAKSAADSAAQAASKVSIDQGADKKNLAMVTDDKGSVYPGYVSADMIADGAVTKDKIASSYIDGSGNSLTAGYGMALVADGEGGAEWGQVGNGGIAEGAVWTDNISTGAVTSDRIADKAVTTDKIADGAVTPRKIASNIGQVGVLVPNGNGGAEWQELGTTGIADGAVTMDKISASGASVGRTLVVASGSTGIELAWGQVGGEGIADSAVGGNHISNYAVTTDKIADSAVTTIKIANYAVTSNKIANNAVTTAAIADGAVSNKNIASSYIDGSGNSLNAGFGMALVADGNGDAKWGQIETAGIAEGAVTWDKIAYDSVKSNNISSGAVTWDKIAYDAVSTHNISGQAVTAEKMSASGQAAGVALVADGAGGATWGQVGSAGIANGAVTASKFRQDDMGQYAGQALVSFEGALTGVGWGQVGTAGIADGAVKREKTEGIVGVIPVGSATDPTSYGSFWIE